MRLRWTAFAVPMKLPSITSKVLLVVFAFTTLWVALVVAAPMMVPAGTLQDLSGVVGGHENEYQFESLSPLPHAIYWMGDGECHQIADRSYFINDNQMPFCARDLGLFLGIALGFGIASFYRLKINPLLLLLGLIPMGIDGGVQLITSYESNNPLRLITGIIAGVSMALLIGSFVLVIQEDRASRRRKSVPVQMQKPEQE